MPYIPNTDIERQEMLTTIGFDTIAELFDAIPAAYRFPKLHVPCAISEMEVLCELEELAAKNTDVHTRPCFLGAGAYRHFIPSIVDFLLRRPEFFTAYTPYQPEVSQGTLQTHFEYQSMMVQLTGMEVAIVSHYDGATAVAEAITMAMQVTREQRNKVLLSPTLHPFARDVARTYTQGLGEVITGDDLPMDDLVALGDSVDRETACVVVQNPDFFGRYYPPSEMQALADTIHAADALLVVSVDPISLGLFQPPGSYGADVVVGEGQPLGNALNYGGPYLGIFATKIAYIRKTAGRIVGETVDAEGRRGYVITLSAREQHIRREKATSNICSNQALNATAAAIYLAVMGKQGLRQVAELCYHKAHYAADLISKLDGYTVRSTYPFFKEFVVQCPLPAAQMNARLRTEYDIVGGFDLGQVSANRDHQLLLCVTEVNTRHEIENLAAALQAIPGGNYDRAVAL